MTIPTAAPAEAPTVGMRCRAWWQEYCDPESGDPAVRARLRRCRSNAEALSIVPAVTLARRLGAIGRDVRERDYRIVRALGLARLLACVRHDASESVMRVAGFRTFPGDDGQSDDSNRPVLSESRFRRLLLTPADESLVTALSRLVTQLDGKANIARLAQDVWWWNDRTRQRWAFEYYAAGVAAPTDRGHGEESDE